MTSPGIRAVLMFLLAVCFGILLVGGYLIREGKPPIPVEAVTQSGSAVFTGNDVEAGKEHYFSRGGQHIGTIWGHGSYLAPDWSADYLHRAGLWLAARHLGLPPARAAAFSQRDLDSLDPAARAGLEAKVAAELKVNRLNPADGRLVLTRFQAEAFRALVPYYTGIFMNGNDRMGIQPGIVTTNEQGRAITSFFAWLAWAAVTPRPGAPETYTSNWPYDPLVGNGPLPGALLWSIASVIVLIFAIAMVIFFYMRHVHADVYGGSPISAFPEPAPSPSQKVTLGFFTVAMALFALQVIIGSGVGHFTVEGTRFFGFPIARYFPYAALRTWHLQLSIFWIASCFTGAGLFIGPWLCREPKGQAWLALALLGSIAVVIAGAMGGTWVSIQGFAGRAWYLLGHQGYEYVELGRIWQIALAAGLVVWLFLVGRSVMPAMSDESDRGGLMHVLLYSAVSIPLFYLPALFYWKGAHLSDAEYWRWWVVHLWVEGFFEVFATAMMAFFLSRIGVVTREFGLLTVHLAIFLYLGSGIVGTFHHLYWSGTPVAVMALGAMFSALEIVPLTILGFEAARNLRAIEQGGPGWPYRWPVAFFIAVAFWNMLGAGVFGFLINPPIVLYYIQGTNTTPLHAHTALYGVYGTLGIALMLFSMRHTVPAKAWSDRLLKWAFWCLNGGLLGMTVLSLVPAGFYQFYQAVRYGMWYARSPEIAAGPVLRALAGIRAIPDLVFWAGAFLMLTFTVRASWAAIRERGAGGS